MSFRVLCFVTTVRLPSTLRKNVFGHTKRPQLLALIEWYTKDMLERTAGNTR